MGADGACIFEFFGGWISCVVDFVGIGVGAGIGISVILGIIVSGSGGGNSSVRGIRDESGFFIFSLLGRWALSPYV